MPPIDQAQQLDAAYIAEGGQGAPFFDAYEFQLGLQLQRQEACTRELLAEIAIVAKECGDAVAAALGVATSNASPRSAHRALAEAEEAARALNAVMRRLASFLPSEVSGVGNNGGTHQ